MQATLRSFTPAPNLKQDASEPDITTCVFVLRPVSIATLFDKLPITVPALTSFGRLSLLIPAISSKFSSQDRVFKFKNPR